MEKFEKYDINYADETVKFENENGSLTVSFRTVLQGANELHQQIPPIKVAKFLVKHLPYSNK